MKFDIKSWTTGNILFSIETENSRMAVEAAVKVGTHLNDADLRYAHLSYANLRSADLRYADLGSADLGSADLSSANLRSAHLRYAHLSSAHLRSADLRSADLSYADLRYADLGHADLRSANLRSAHLNYAHLRSADLSSAHLNYADLSYADLSYADLSSAHLSSADLSSADLSYADGVNKNRVTPIRILLDQPGPIWAYKLVNAKGEGPFNGGINYLNPKVDEFTAHDFDNSETEQCGSGINLATLDWCMKQWKNGYRILIMEFFANKPTGNLCVPTATDGKFRVKTCRRVGEKDLKELGLEE